VKKPVLVLKFGTSTITDRSGQPDEQCISWIAASVARLHTQYAIIIVSSGAVGAGKGSIPHYKGELLQRKAAAAVGNPILIQLYSKYFRAYNISIAQSLCERRHFGDREAFLQLKQTFEALWDADIIPIVNENDVVSSRELKFSDNDELAALIASGFGANRLMICTSAGGLLDPQGKVIPKIDQIQDAFQWVKDVPGGQGLGGMNSKLTYTKLTIGNGIPVIIFGLSHPTSILQALEGKEGTFFPAIESQLNSKERWMMSSAIKVGSVIIDDGAVEAIKQRKSLLAVGVIECKGSFQSGELIEVCDIEGYPIAVGLIRHHASWIEAHKGTRGLSILHANDIVLL
jgi:glutamate 5-kinase